MRVVNRCGSLSRYLGLHRHLPELGSSSQAVLFLVIKALKACSGIRELELGERIFARQCLSVSSDLFVATAAVDMFAKCGNLEQAQAIFDSMAFRDIVSWNALMQGYVLHGREDYALDLFSRIQSSRSISPDARSFIAAIMACSQLATKQQAGSIDKVSSLKVGSWIHSEVKNAGFESDVFVASALVDMYSSCGSLADARKVFDAFAPDRRDVVIWTGLIMGYVSNAQPDRALELFESMTSCSSTCRPNSRTFVSAIAACTALASKEAARLIGGKLVKVASLELGSRIHSEAAKRGFGSDLFVANCAVDMYAKCGFMIRARQVFDGIVRRSVVSWTSLMMGYVENDEPEQALAMFRLMAKQSSDPPSSRSFVAALLACSSMASKEQARKLSDRRVVKPISLETGTDLYSQALEQGFGSDSFVANASIDMFAKCGSMDDACGVFRAMKQPDVISYTSLIMGYAANGENDLALETLSRMEDSRGCEPNARTFVAGLVACGNLISDDRSAANFALDKGREIRSKVVARGYISDVFVVNSLITMFSKCGSLFEARQIFDDFAATAAAAAKPDVVSWNALISGYVDNGEAEAALELFARIDSPDSRSFVAALSACSALASRESGSDIGDAGSIKVECLEKVMDLHSAAKQSGFDSDRFLSNRLIDAYAKCGSMLDSRRVFDRAPDLSSVSWTSLISGYADNGQPETALGLFESMLDSEPDTRTFLAALSALSILASTETGETIDGKLVKVAALERGRALRSRARTSGIELEQDGFAANALVNFYSKCGSMPEARDVFDSVPLPGVASWTSLMLGYSDNGQSEMALEMFARMRLRIEPDSVALAAALVACAEVVERQTGKNIHAEIYRRGEDSRSLVLANGLMDFYAKCGTMDCSQRVFDSIADWKDVVAWNCLIAGYGRLGESTMALELFARMIDEGIKPSAVTFVSLLTMCSHCGLIEQGKRLFEAMVPGFGVHPTVQHYTCMVDLLARADSVEDAISTVETMPYAGNEVMWTAVMGAKARIG